MSRIKKWKRRLIMWSWIYALAALVRCLAVDAVWLWPSVRKILVAVWFVAEPVVRPRIEVMEKTLGNTDPISDAWIIATSLILLIVAIGVIVAIVKLSAPMRRRLFPEEG